MRYCEEIFFNLENSNNNNYKVTQETIDYINNFSDKIKNNNNTKIPFFIKNNKKKYFDHNNDSINFKKTVLNKKFGIHNNIDIIRKHLNKISQSTYDNLKDLIMQEIDNILTINNDNTLDNQSNLDLMNNTIFDICSSNLFLSHLYSNLYYELYNKFIVINEFFKIKTLNLHKIILDIKYVNPNVDYDKYCDYNKYNDQIKSLVNFYINLFKKDNIEKNIIINNILLIQNKIIENIESNNILEINDELSDILYIFISQCYTLITISSEWEIIYNNINYIANLKKKPDIYISNKTIFKHMDILDIIS